MREGDLLFLYTDGVTEACDVNEIEFGEKRLPISWRMATARPRRNGSRGLSKRCANSHAASRSSTTSPVSRSNGAGLRSGA